MIRPFCTFAQNLSIMLPKNTFANKKVFVIGGATGLGYAMSKKYAQLGATVVIASRKIDIVRKSVKDIKLSSN